METVPRLASQSPLWSEADKVTALCEEMRPDSPARLAAEGLLAQPPRVPTSEEAKSLIAMLLRPRWQPLWSRSNRQWLVQWHSHQPDYAERTVVVWLLGVLDLPVSLRVEAGRALLGTAGLWQGIRHYGIHGQMMWRDGLRGALRAYLFSLPIGTIAFLMFGLILHSYTKEYDFATALYMATITAAVIGTVLAPWMVLFSLELSSGHRSTLRAMALRALVSSPDAKAVDFVARACFSKNRTLKVAALLTIDGVLPALMQEDYGRLAAQTVPRLCRILTEGIHNYLSPSVQMSIVDALAKVGDGQALPTLTQIVLDDRIRSPFEKMPRIPMPL